MRIAILSLLGFAMLSANEMQNSLSFQGYTGLINTPNAQVMQEGDLSFSFNNQFDNHLRGYDYNKPKSYSEDYVFGVGLLPNLEIQGRFKEQKGYTRDLSANIKYQIPKFYEFMPNIAVGVQDLGSAAANYENYYIVADKQFWFLRGSLGYGYSNTNRTERMDGFFGGLEAEVMPWFTVMGEYDSEETHVAARFMTPEDWVSNVKLHATVASNLSEDGQASFMVSAVFPLGQQKHSISIPVAETEPMQETKGKAFKKSEDISPVTTIESTTIQQLVDALSADGLRNITVGTDKDTLYIAYENWVYLHNEVDAMQAVLKEAVKLSGKYTKFSFTIKQSNVNVSTFAGSLTAAAAYHSDPSSENLMAFKSSLTQVNNDSPQGNIFATNANSTRFKPHIVLTPELTSFVGTDLSAFDYQLLLGTIAYVNLYDGLDFTLHYNIPVSYSDNLDPVYGLFGYAYDDGGLHSTMLNYSNEIFDGINTVSAGLYDYDYAGLMDQFLYKMDNHTFKFKVGYFEHTDYSDVNREVYLAKYTYHFTPMDIFAEIEGGKYWYQDTGFGVAFKRFFGDVAVTLDYLQTTPENYVRSSEDPNRYVGLSIELPLDFSKSKLSGKYGQVNGDKAWQYKRRSTIAREDGTNTIVPFNSGYDPLMDVESETYFYNRNRLSEDYMKENAERILGE